MSSRPVSVTASRLVEQHEVVGQIDVEGEVGITHDAQAEPEPPGLGGVTAEGAGAVGEGEG